MFKKIILNNNMAENNDNDNIIDFFKRTQRGLQKRDGQKEEPGGQKEASEIIAPHGAGENILKTEFFKHFPYISNFKFIQQNSSKMKNKYKEFIVSIHKWLCNIQVFRSIT